jgi:predicted transcriptional regulator
VAEWDFDLLGDAIPEGFDTDRRRGRPPHLVTEEKRRKVMVLAAFDRNEEQIAAALSITPPTLRKHYFRELRSRLEARQRLEGKLLAALLTEVDKGNVSAIDKLFKRLDKHDLATVSDRVSNRGKGEAKPPKLG